jgi:hypothetical protein
MTRFLIDGLAIVALAFTALAAPPARAEGGGELLSLLLGVGTVYAIGKGIEQAREPLPKPVPVSHASRTDRTLPRDCLSTFQTRHGELRGFDRRCLAHAMPRLDRLPADCAIETRVGHRDATIYTARCLQLDGWEVARPRADWRQVPAWRHTGHVAPRGQTD